MADTPFTLEDNQPAVPDTDPVVVIDATEDVDPGSSGSNFIDAFEAAKADYEAEHADDVIEAQDAGIVPDAGAHSAFEGAAQALNADAIEAVRAEVESIVPTLHDGVKSAIEHMQTTRDDSDTGEGEG